MLYDFYPFQTNEYMLLSGSTTTIYPLNIFFPFIYPINCVASCFHYQHYFISPQRSLDLIRNHVVALIENMVRSLPVNWSWLRRTQCAFSLLNIEHLSKQRPSYSTSSLAAMKYSWAAIPLKIYTITSSMYIMQPDLHPASCDRRNKDTLGPSQPP